MNDIIVIVVENGLDKLISNPGQGCLNFMLQKIPLRKAQILLTHLPLK